MTDLHIPSFRLADCKPSEKAYYVYTVDVNMGGRHRCAERRYSQFQVLHRQLRKEIQTPLFPCKRVRCTQPRLLEQRRRGLELYLRTVFQQSASCRSQILTFLGIPQQPTLESCEATKVEVPMDHRPIFIYKNDPYIQPNSKSDLPDVVVNGMLMALYNIQGLS